MKKPTPGSSAWPELGFMYADWASEKDRYTIFVTDIFSFTTMTVEQRQKVQTITFATVEELLDAGWVVD